MSDIVWEEPPKQVISKGNYGRHAAIAAELKAHPGQWAKVATAMGANQAGQIKRAVFKAYEPAGSFEAVSRNSRKIDGHSRCDIYARYIGEATE